ncbi:MAG TPA: Spy/CpxP family protein refolding chaperone [Chthonomonadales bacterium]|nr:Spy/CpxP family protein refolding chaperone [Chthonomonadales bacterium]
MRRVILMAIILAFALPAAQLAVAQGGPPPGGPRGQGRVLGPQSWFGVGRESARQRLGITREQQEQIEALWAQMDQARRENMQRLGALYMELGKAYDAFEVDDAQIRRIRRQILQTHKEGLERFSQSEDRLRSILTREQFGKLKTMMRDMWQRMPERRPRREGR